MDPWNEEDHSLPYTCSMKEFSGLQYLNEANLRLTLQSIFDQYDFVDPQEVDNEYDEYNLPPALIYNCTFDNFHPTLIKYGFEKIFEYNSRTGEVVTTWAYVGDGTLPPEEKKK